MWLFFGVFFIWDDIKTFSKKIAPHRKIQLYRKRVPSSHVEASLLCNVLSFCFSLLETITLSEEHIQAGLRDGTLSIPDSQVIESGSLDEGQVEVISHGHIIEEEGQVIESGDGVMSEEEEEEENEEDVEQEGMIAMEHLSDSVVEENLSVGEDLNMQITWTPS